MQRGAQTMNKLILRCLFVALPFLAVDQASADYGFSLAISPEVHVQPGDVVNLPARFTNTGNQAISFGSGYSGLAGSFNGVTLQPGDSLDFAYLNIRVHDDAVPGVSDKQYPILGIAFPGGVDLLAASYTQPVDSGFFSQIVVGSETYALPLSKVSQAQPGYFSSSASLDLPWIVLLSITDMAFADTQFGPAADAIELPIVSVPEPGVWLTLVLGFGLVFFHVKWRGLSSPLRMG